MLPISLTLRNFLSYRESAPTLQLDGVHVACLCGPNGHGKSALLDAITWALWGKARGQRQEQLLHHGQDEMVVDLEFDVGAERYRIARRYSRARRTAQSSLELSIETGEGYRPITGDSIGATQAHVSRLISMDYETFVNSAFLLQGRADMFTMSTPTQRKEVLSRVLGLGLYDRLEERAKQRGRNAHARLQASGLVLDRLREQTGKREETRSALDVAEAELVAAEQSATTLRERLDLVRRQVALLERRRAEEGELDAQKARVRIRLEEAKQEATRLQERVARWHATLEHAEETDAGFVALSEARKHLESLNAAAQTLHAMERDLFPLEQAITAAKAALERDAQSQGRHIEQELRPRAESLPGIEQRLAKLAGELSAVEARKPEVAALEEHRQVLLLDAKRLEMENARLGELGKETGRKLALLDHEHADEATCPLCGTALAPEGRSRIRETYEREIAEQRAQFREQAAKAKQAAAEADELDREIAELRQKLDAERQRLQSEQARVTVQVEDARRAQAQMEQARRVLAEAEGALARQSYAASEQVKAKDLRAQIEELGFDSEALADAGRRAHDLAPWEVAHQSLVEARTRLPEDEAALASALQRAREAEEEQARLEARWEELRKESADLPGFQAQERVLVPELASAEERCNGLQARRGALAHQLKDIAAAESELRLLEAEWRATAEEAAAYVELALAFGKGGVQALLIEAAIPRLEDEANDLLKRMTDGRMSLKLETQRARRTGRGADTGDIETLEIIIADELGTRSYEMFSGGERFRIDLAVRIALSKLLAWRAGAPLPTLFIDEGFGTQDNDGRDRILDVIKAIEDRFQRILVITHMDEIKEAFPVRIEVSRTPGAGSTFALV